VKRTLSLGGGRYIFQGGVPTSRTVVEVIKSDEVLRRLPVKMLGRQIHLIGVIVSKRDIITPSLLHTKPWVQSDLEEIYLSKSSPKIRGDGKSLARSCSGSNTPKDPTTTADWVKPVAP